MVRLSLVVFAGCGRIAFDSVGDARSGSGGDGGGGGDGSGTGVCRTLAFTDKFEDMVADPRWAPFADSGYTVVEAGGALQISYAANVAASSFAGYDQVTPIAIEGGCVRAQLVMIPSTAAPSAFAFIRIGTATDKAQLGVGNNARLSIQMYTSGMPTVDQNTAYSSVAHQYLGFRIEGGDVYFEASSDNVTWNSLRAPVTASFDPASATIEIGAGTTSQPATNAGTVMWDDLEVWAP